jgi:predicted permease
MTFLSGIGHDVRIACRSLAQQPLFSLMIVGILTIGIAGTTTIFSLFNGVFLRPLPIPDQGRVVNLDEVDPKSGQQQWPSYPQFHAWRQYNHTFETMAFSSQWVTNVSRDGMAERVGMRLASWEFFAMFGIRPVLGRSFTAEEDRPGGPKVVLLSASLWNRMFGKDPTIIGRTVRLDDDPSYTVVGILPDATFPDHKDVWCPLCGDPDKGAGGLGPMAVGRLKPGVSIEQARDDLAGIHKGWAEQHPDKQVITLPKVTLLRESYLSVARQFRFALSLILAIVALVLLIACCNVTSTMLARGISRNKETATRAALGATWGRIVQQVLAESLVLSVAGGIGGVLLGAYALRFVLVLLGKLVPVWMTFTLDVRCMLFCLLIIVATTLLSGLLPALYAASPRDLHAVLQASGTRATSSRARRRTLNAIVTAQIALALTLLAGAGLILRTFLKVQDIDPGFHTAGILTYNVPLSIGAYIDENKRHAFWEQHVERVRALPGVVHAALVNNAPMSIPAIRKFETEGKPNTSGEQSPQVLVRRITPDYFETLGIPLLAGRGFTENDNRRDSERTVVVDKTFAERFWPDENPIDKRIRQQGSQDWVRVIGVVKDVRQISLEESPQPGIYLPRVTDAAFGMCGIVQTSGDPLSVVPSIRAVIQSVDPGVPIENVQTMSQRVHESTSGRRLALWLYGLPALVAGILAFAGIYGVTSYAVSQRTREIGIRAALGATRCDVLRMVIGQGARLILVGLGIGLVGAFVLGRVLANMQDMLCDVSPSDPLTFIGVCGLLGAAAVLACYLPARRAARTDPIVALRYE